MKTYTEKDLDEFAVGFTSWVLRTQGWRVFKAIFTRKFKTDEELLREYKETL